MLELKNSLRQNLESYVRDCVKSGIHYKDALQQLEMEYVMQVLGQTAYNVSKAADVLGINRNTLSKKILEFRSFEKFRNHQKLHNAR
jgi:DNA-binding protein Fis